MSEREYRLLDSSDFMKKLLHRINLFSPRDIMTCDHIIGIILNRFDVFRSKLKAL